VTPLHSCCYFFRSWHARKKALFDGASATCVAARACKRSVKKHCAAVPPGRIIECLRCDRVRLAVSVWHCLWVQPDLHVCEPARHHDCVRRVVSDCTLTREHAIARREHFNALPSKCHDAVFGIALIQVDDYRTDPALFKACKVRRWLVWPG